MAEDKKIIIDEDWKSQVEAEKQQAQQPGAGGAESARQPGEPAMPPASLDLLITMLATEALVAMGQMPHPATQQMYIQPAQAKYLIDMIEVLRDKTKGNLTPDEQQLIDGVLHELRVGFLETSGQSAGSAAAGGKSPLEL